MKTILCIFALALCLIPACRSRGPSGTADPAHTLTGDWNLKALGSQPVSAPKPPWIRIEVGGGLRGWAGVNQISSQLDQAAMSRSEFKPSPIIATRMAGPPEAMKIESDLLAALQTARTYSAHGDTLELRDASGGSVATFARKPTP
jgi:heat shock protein HslJ